jgi:trimethylamine:corrinoid methyltransferase-like protein
MADRAFDEVQRILGQTTPPLVDEKLQKELRKIMAADAKQNGAEKLPEIPTTEQERTAHT